MSDSWKGERPQSYKERHCSLDRSIIWETEDSCPHVQKVAQNLEVCVLRACVILLIEFIVYQNVTGPSELACTRFLNPYSPTIEAGVISYHDTEFENEFAHNTKYRGPPTPELEQAWDQLWNRGGFEVPFDGPARLNKSRDQLRHVHTDSNRGYTAMMEVFHQLHCLNLIRQYTWKDYYEKHDNLKEWVDQPENLLKVDINITNTQDVGDRMRVDHCIETLRLILMCNGDVTPLLVKVDPESKLGYSADFNTHHKCRDWNQLVEWQEKHNIDNESRS